MPYRPTKLTKALLTDAEAWVEEHGLHPQRFGATVVEFCKAMDISAKSYERYQANDEFVAALTRARKVFEQRKVKVGEEALLEAATGKAIKAIKDDGTIVYYAPDTKAVIFMLTNMASDKWKDKQTTDVTSSDGSLHTPSLVIEKVTPPQE